MRDLPWNGGRNLRDLGGIPTSMSPTGMTVRGRIARGARRELLTGTGWSAAQVWGLRSVVDLRSADEVGARDGDADVPAPPDVTMVLAPTEDQTHPEFRSVCLPILDSPEYWRHNVRILPDFIRGALNAVARSEPGILVHCAAGRDRTGMVTALLLANAGASADDVFADYAASVRSMAGTAAHGGPTHDRHSRWTSAQTTTWLTTVRPHVDAFIASADSVIEEIGLDIAVRQRLRALLIDPALDSASRQGAGARDADPSR
jgi:hypothetical protein